MVELITSIAGQPEYVGVIVMEICSCGFSTLTRRAIPSSTIDTTGISGSEMPWSIDHARTSSATLFEVVSSITVTIQHRDSPDAGVAFL